MKKILFIIWLAGWLVTYPALLADFRDPSAFSCRRDMGFAMMLAALPPIWIITPFITGFYENGFQFTCEGVRHE